VTTTTVTGAVEQRTATRNRVRAWVFVRTAYSHSENPSFIEKNLAKYARLAVRIDAAAACVSYNQSPTIT
jgi:hypothetical protein